MEAKNMMKRIVSILIVLITMTTMNAQTLSQRQKSLASCARAGN